jgi:hypothetical protein
MAAWDSMRGFKAVAKGRLHVVQEGRRRGKRGREKIIVILAIYPVVACVEDGVGSCKRDYLRHLGDVEHDGRRSASGPGRGSLSLSLGHRR